MRVHPAPARKSLRRLPHIFTKVLELPLQSNADVSVEEALDCFRFVANTDGDIGGDFRARTVEMLPGITKIVVIRGDDDYPGLCVTIQELELDVWRFRLPAATLPAMASADYNNGRLTVTVPKDPNHDGSDEIVWGEEGNGGFLTGPKISHCAVKSQFD